MLALPDSSLRSLTTRQRTFLLVAVALGVLLNPLNASMISVAVARLQHVFDLRFSSASWLISTYYLASAISQPVMGKLADLLGRRRLFFIGLALAAVSAAAAPFAPSFQWLITLRLIQSVGSGAIYPAGMGIVREYIGDNQARALAFLAVFSGGAAAFGPSIGGLLMRWHDWPSIFWVNFPFIISSALLGWWFLPRDRPLRLQARDSSVGTSGMVLLRGLDWPGIALFSGTVLTTLVFLLSIPTTVEWWAAGLAVVLCVAFLWRELQAASPFIDIRMFRSNLPLSWVLIQFVTVNAIFYSIFFGIPTYLQEVRHFDPQRTGLIMLSVAGLGVVMAPLTGRWVDKSGARPPLLLAAWCMTIGSSLLLTLHDHSPVWWLVIILSVLGLSSGLNNVALQTALFRVAPQDIISAASGLFQTARYLGAILSTVLLGMLFGQHLSTGQIHRLAAVLVGFAVMVIGMSWRLPRQSALS